MLYRAIEDAYPIFVENWVTDMEVLRDARKVPIDCRVTVKKRRDALVIAATEKLTHPFLGIYWGTALTQARWQQQREAVVSLLFDYIARGPDDEVLEVQCESAVEAILRSVDRLAGQGDIMGAGEGTGTISVEADRTAQQEGQSYYQERVIVTVPVQTLSTGLT